MKWQIIILPSAEIDLLEASEWYESRGIQELGEKFLEEIDQTINKLAITPEAYPLYYRGFRRILVIRFPYKIFYQIEENRIVIFRILHAKRNHSPCFNAV